MIVTGHVIHLEHSGNPASVQGTALALSAAADHLTRGERPRLTAASLLRQTAAVVAATGGSVDTIGASPDDIADITLTLVLPDAGLFARYVAIAEQLGLVTEQLLVNLASIGFKYHELFGLIAGLDSNEDKESEDGYDD